MRRLSHTDEFLHNPVLLILYPLQISKDVSDLRQDDSVVVILAKFATDGELVGTVHRLIEVATQPCQILLVFPVEGCHLIQRLNSAYGADVIELADSITNHCADILIVGCFPLKQRVLFESEPDFAYFSFILHVILNINTSYEYCFPAYAGKLLLREYPRSGCGHKSTTC